MHVFVWMCFVCVSMPMYIFRGHIFQLTESLFPNTRDRTRAPCGAQSPNHWTAREVHVHMYFCIMSTHVLSCSCVCVLCTCSQMCVCVGEGGSSAPGVPKTQASYLGTWGFEATCTRTDTCTDTSSNNKGNNSNSWHLLLLY